MVNGNTCTCGGPPITNHFAYPVNADYSRDTGSPSLIRSNMRSVRRQRLLYWLFPSTSGLPIDAGISLPLQGGNDVILGRVNDHYEIQPPETWMPYYGGMACPA